MPGFRVADPGPPRRWQVLQHGPGPAWEPGTPRGEQPGIELHFAFIDWLTERGLLVAGGPLVDADAEGMFVVRFAEQAEAELAATTIDQAVVTGLLTVRVRPWLVVAGPVLEQPAD
jgi:uncharacterized protein YciI